VTGLMVEDLNEEEKIVYDVIRRETLLHGGVYHIDLRSLEELKNFSSQKIHRIVSKLLKKGLIERIEREVDGRRVFLLRAIDRGMSKSGESQRVVDIELDLARMISIPCIGCRYINSCFEGGAVSPSRCPLLLRALIALG